MADPRTQGEVTASRISNLDLLRGVAVLGILVMNAVSYGLPDAAYFNLRAGGTDTRADWLIGGFNEIFVDQKMMGLFSMLFGASIVLFCDRADANGRNGTRLSLWRNTLLLGIGLLHGWLWEGDVLTVYALCAPVLLIARRWKPRTLIVTGTTIVFAFGGLTRWQIAIFVAVVWALELAWSKPWLTRFRYGPLEWAWRTATYRKRQPFQRA